MPRTAYVNGRYVPHAHAMIHVEDRACMFADGVYEVCLVRDGEIVDLDLHLDRLWRSLGELRIDAPMERLSLVVAMREIVRRNRVDYGLLYMQVSRGVAHRDHAFPAGVRPTLVMLAWATDPARGTVLAKKGVKVITQPDIRWARRDIKSVSLLPNVLAKQAAREAGAFEAWLVDDDGYVTEGTSANAWIVTTGGTIVTRNLSNAILSGVTRLRALEVAEQENLKFEERGFTLAEALKAKEAFQSSTTLLVVPVVEIDGKKIGTGKPGPVTLKLRKGLAG
jgi:D-alanine transaminase